MNCTEEQIFALQRHTVVRVTGDDKYESLLEAENVTGSADKDKSCYHIALENCFSFSVYDAS